MSKHSNANTTKEIFSGFHVVAVKPDGKQIDEVVGKPKSKLQDKKAYAVVVTDANGVIEASGDKSAAIGGYGSDAKAGPGGIAHVLGVGEDEKGGKASTGPRGVSVVRQSGIAETGDGGVACTMRSGKSIVGGRGVAVALNDRHRLDATAQAELGGILVFSYCPTPTNDNTPMEFVCARVDNKEILPHKPYKVTKNGEVVPAK